MSDALWPHESQHARTPCPSPTFRVHPNSCPSSQRCRPAISSSVIPFSPSSQSLPSSGSFPMSQLFAWGGQSTGVSALASVLPKNTQDWSLFFPIFLFYLFIYFTLQYCIGFAIYQSMDWLDLLVVQGTRKSSPTPQFKSINSLVFGFLHSPTLTSIHDHWKNHSHD